MNEIPRRMGTAVLIARNHLRMSSADLAIRLWEKSGIRLSQKDIWLREICYIRLSPEEVVAFAATLNTTPLALHEDALVWESICAAVHNE